ncbi:uncharacterized protein LOC116927216 [Daphnia magna]|uniref:Platelet-derived growth factor (PDGF) family profile domain-containing protein n=1 Tax=Daphnia magna TaxID=35525 RepID=A0A164ZSG1_9CRUS|nr:uncharacterized protein LOC116927216 [Daphnia magna]KZS16697.1 Uncharacterized protein APZ42_017291 [Daphnia magna]
MELIHRNMQPKSAGSNMMSYKLLTCIVAAILLPPLVDSVKIVPLKKNLKTFNDWTCNKPQPRVVHIDNLDEYIAPNAIYLPSALVIHRCDQSTGCCRTPGQVCKSVESEEEDIQFAIRANFIDNSGRADPSATKANNRNKTKKEKKLMVTLRNHTRCDCVGKVDLRV